MLLLFVQFSLPLLLGYSLFAGITGRVNPLDCPKEKINFKSWKLGVCAGATICIAFTLYIHIAYAEPASRISTLLIPVVTVIMTMAALWLTLRTSLRVIQVSTKSSPEIYRKAGVTPRAPSDSTLSCASQQRKPSNSLEDLTQVSNRKEKHRAEVSPAYLRNLNVERLDLHAHKATNDTVDIYLALDDEPGPSAHSSEQPTAARLQGHPTNRISNTLQLSEPLSSQKSSLADGATAARNSDVTRSVEPLQTEQLQLLEEAVARERAKRQIAEKQSETLKRMLMSAKQDVRRYSVARAKALSTANKSIAFARQAVEFRGRLEKELAQANATIITSHNIIRKLHLALGKMKGLKVASSANTSSAQHSSAPGTQGLFAARKPNAYDGKLMPGLTRKVARAKTSADIPDAQTKRAR